MNEITMIIGLIASVYGFSMRIPQIYKIIVTKSATDLSYVSIFIGTTSELLWFSYGYLREDLSIILSSAGHFTIVTLLLIIKCYFDKKKNRQIQDNDTE